jgi:predicted RNA binding protein YcfA (HicA-like mRNA interferase family)
MSKHLPTLSGRDVVNALKKVGFREIPGRGKGSHVFIYRDAPPKGITVPAEKDIKRGTLRAIIRQSELSVDDFLALL